MRLKLPFSTSFLCHSTAVASISRQRKKDTPQSLLKLSEVSTFCHRVNWNGFPERMFFPAHYSTVISCFQSVTVILLPSVLCLCSRMTIFPAKFRPCAFQMLSGYFHTIQHRKTHRGPKIALLDEFGNILPNIKKRINFIVPLVRTVLPLVLFRP